MIKLGPLRLENLSEATLFTGLIGWHRTAMEGLEEIAACRRDAFGTTIPARVFVNQGTRDDLGHRISVNSRDIGETLEGWLTRLYGAGEHCVALNAVNAWSERIDDIVREHFLADWLAAFGGPLGGIDVYAFMGRYPITPFGIHKDAEHTFLYHLGPGQKHAWVWNPDRLESDGNWSTGKFSLEFAEKSATKAILNPGDVLFIPAGHYHVLANPTFSATLGIAPYDRPVSAFVASALEETISEPCSTLGFFSVHLDNVENVGTREIDALFNLETLSGRSLAARLRERCYKELRRMASNNFLKYGPPERRMDVSLASRFACGYHQINLVESESLHLFARGYEYDLPLAYLWDMKAAVESLNSTGIYSVGSFLKAHEFSCPDVIEDIVSRFIRTGVVRTVA